MDRGFLFGNPPDFDGDDDLIIQRIDSGDIIYSNPYTKYKLVGSYIFGNKLGSGSYAKVKECLHAETLRRCAVKIMKKKDLRKIPHGAENVKREIKLLRNLSHENIIKLLNVHYNDEKGKIYMMMEYCVAVLQEMLESTPDKKFPIFQAHRYFVQLLDGLEYLHSRGVVHKDIKPGNLLLSCDQTLKIADFGVAEQVSLMSGSDLISCTQGSPMFQPPESSDSNYPQFPGFKLDVWSSGCTLFNLTTGKYPFNGSDLFRVVESIRDDPLVIPRELDDDLTSLLEGMLNKDPYRRMSLQEVKKHTWVQMRPCRGPGDVEVSMWGKRSDSGSHWCSVIPYLQCHYFPDDSRQYITEHDMHAGVSPNAEFDGSPEFPATRAGEMSPSRNGGNALRRKRGSKNAKPTSCVTLRNLATCTQS